MNQPKKIDFTSMLEAFSTQRLELLLPEVLRELRRRDSKHLKADAITTSRDLRLLRRSGKLP